VEKLSRAVLLSPPPTGLSLADKRFWRTQRRPAGEPLFIGPGNTAGRHRQSTPFPRGNLLQTVAAQQYGAEFMSSLAACRTFNILALEGRAVIAAVILPL
jgi:uncharacterized protein